MTKSFLRGHPIFFENDEWLYTDTKAPTINNERACGYCLKANTKEDHDGCLGILHGVMNACCGHGQINEAYIQFSDGNIVRGILAKNIMKKLLKNS